jgi:lysyl-tRNA synthetase class 1
MTELRDAAMTSKAWPFEEARRLLKRYEKAPPEKGHVLFETGYGPSGLPHIGTFGEVLRTTMIRRAFEVISDIPTRLICFSDDMDGMRKVPGNVPNQEMLREHLQKPLTRVPDPFGTSSRASAHHNNAMLRRFLDTFGFEYEFYSATDFYASGQFDEILLRAAERYDALMKVMLKSLREERQQTYSIFLPLHPETGRVLYVPIKHVDAKEGTVTFDDETGREWTVPVTGGQCKLQWKPDFGARWAALGVDFEMYGKDHSTNTPIYDAICEILGAPAPEHFTYELFLDENGQKISKSSGNGISIDEWLSYAATESLSLLHVQKPKTAKRLYFDVIPKAVDEYHQQLRAYPEQDARAAAGEPGLPHPFGRRSGLDDDRELRDAAEPRLRRPRRGQGGALGLHPPLRARGEPRDPSRPRRRGRLRGALLQRFREAHEGLPRATDQERAAMEELVGLPRRCRQGARRHRAQERAGGQGHALPEVDWQDDEFLQSIVFAVGKTHGFEPLRAWFSALYEVLMGASQGPRFGGFIALYGIDETRR